MTTEDDRCYCEPHSKNGHPVDGSLDVERLRTAMVAVLGDDEVSTADGSASVRRAADLVAREYAKAD